MGRIPYVSPAFPAPHTSVILLSNLALFRAFEVAVEKNLLGKDGKYSF